MTERLEKLRREHGTAGCTLVSVEDWAANEIERQIYRGKYQAGVIEHQRAEIADLRARFGLDHEQETIGAFLARLAEAPKHD